MSYRILEKCFLFDSSDSNYLKILTDNGQAEVLESGDVEVPFENVYELDEIDRGLLDLPELYPFEIYIEHHGIFLQESFRYDISFRTFAPGGQILPKTRLDGPIVTLKIDNLETTYLLSKEQFKLLRAIEDFHAAVEKSPLENCKSFAQIKTLSAESAAILDTTLNNREVLLPERVKLDISLSGGQLEITPQIGEEYNEEFAEKFDQNEEVPERYQFRNPQKKIFIALDSPVREELKKVKKLRREASPEKIKQIVNHPEEFFNPEIADLSEFYSDRVLGKGFYEPKVIPFLSPYKSQWIPGVQVEDRTNGTTHIFIHNEKELVEFHESLEIAKREQKPFFEYKGANFTIEEAERFYNSAKEQLQKKERVRENGEGSVQKKKTEILIIEENIENLGYVVSQKAQLPKKLVLHEDPHLDKRFQLKRHQEEGIAWLQNLSLNSKGGLLADDMGLGKTLQVLYLLDWHSRQPKSDKPYLVVAPKILLENWENEYKKFFPDGMPVEIIRKIPPDGKTFIEQHTRKHIMVVGYETMRRGQMVLGRIDFAIIILDEAQKIKEPGTMVTNAAKALKSDLRISLTGTPVENSYMNLWCIMDFSVPGLLGCAKAFAREFQTPLKISGTNVQELGAKLRQRVGNHFLRRLKSEIRDELPKKEIIHKMIPMPDEQLKIYMDAVQSGVDESQKKMNPLARINRLKEISAHPYLFKSFENIPTDSLIQSSAKMQATIEILDEIKERGEKAIVFAELHKMQRMLQQVLFHQYGIEASIINGETPTGNDYHSISRQKAIDLFQETSGFNVILMSPLAAGVGLNIVGANHVIHYMRHWNPAKEMQATDRVYRIGQTKDVFVHIPMAICDGFDSFDVVLDALLKNKMNLATAALFPTEQIEISTQEIDEKLFRKGRDHKPESVSEKDVYEMEGHFFEAFVFALYTKMGYDCTLTPNSGDKGVDVLARKENSNFAIQCKRTTSSVNADAIREVVAGIPFYSQKDSKKYSPIVLTTGTFNQDAKTLAECNHVELIDREKLMIRVRKYPICWSEIFSAESKREG